eukprot:TRINITY_DN4150_c0_g2_i1.p2 TRINITY_DN4150_c0_g2~~TRINITY_DN4150_c0_g2_i1.p2  ORF type:complete len:190 (+),score=28.52 TRINITY_DN4150_c0_g2_i1:52-621(+)
MCADAVAGDAALLYASHAPHLPPRPVLHPGAMADWHRLASRRALDAATTTTAWARITGQRAMPRNPRLRRAGERVIHGLAVGQHPIVIPSMAEDAPPAPRGAHHPPCPICRRLAPRTPRTRDSLHVLLHCWQTGQQLDLNGTTPSDTAEVGKLVAPILRDPEALLRELLSAGDLPGTIGDYLRPEVEPD